MRCRLLKFRQINTVNKPKNPFSVAGTSSTLESGEPGYLVPKIQLPITVISMRAYTVTFKLKIL